MSKSRAKTDPQSDAMTPRFSFDKETSMVSMTIPGIPGLQCDVYCYEDNFGKAVDGVMDGKDLVLTHKDPKLEGVVATTRFVPSPGGVDQIVTVTGPNEAAVRAVTAMNPCVQFMKSSAFGRQQDWRSDYVSDFIPRCFVYLETGFTPLSKTKRVPGTITETYEHSNKTNSENPWIQEYYPAWRKHPGQQKGERGYSTDRPVYPIIGVVSYDGRHMAAVAWPETNRLGQVWMYCIHPRPGVGESYDRAANKIVSRGKYYFIPYDPAALLAAFHKDFPNWKMPEKK